MPESDLEHRYPRLVRQVGSHGLHARMWWSMLVLGIKRSARQVNLAERAVEGVLRTALGLWLLAISVLVAYHVQPIGLALLGTPAGVHVPATAWILTCVVVGVLHNAAFQLPATTMPLLLTVPVSRRAIAVVALATKAAHPSNFIIGVFLVVLWWFNIYTLQPLPEALAWLVAAILLYLSSWLLGVAVRTRNAQTTEPLLVPVWATTISGSVLTSLYIVSYSGRWSILVAIVLVSLASMMMLRRIEAVLHVDTRDATARVVSSSYFSFRPWRAMLQLQKHLLLRSPRARHLLTDSSGRLWVAGHVFVCCRLWNGHEDVYGSWSKLTDRCCRTGIHWSFTKTVQHLLRWHDGMAEWSPKWS